MVFQDPYLSLNRSEPIGKAVARNLRLHGVSTGRDLRHKTIELLDAAGLSAEHVDKLPSQLSGGQRQRVAIARGIAANPRVLVLDEAVSALDVSVQAQILALLRDLQEQEGMTYLFVSHDLAVINEMSDTVIVMKSGIVVEPVSYTHLDVYKRQATLLGTLLAIFSAWFGGLVDVTIARLLDILFAVPGIIFALVAVALVGPGQTGVVIGLAIAYVPYVARVIRGAAIRERHLPYVESSWVQGVHSTSIVLGQILPNLKGLVVAQAVANFGLIIVCLLYTSRCV